MDPTRNDPLVDFVLAVIERSVGTGASDIHFEPLRSRFRVRHRVDGILIDAGELPLRLCAAILSRLKLMAGMSIAEKRAPQDGRSRIDIAGRNMDFRVSSVPGLHGESIVLRVIDSGPRGPRLEELGFLPDDLLLWRQWIGSTSGLVLATGPTGSGKSTTLFSSLAELNGPGRKIVTVEDPVECRIPGLNQVQVRPEIGMTFASALRAILRQSPNVVMIGEIRDPETAGIALKASLTGHLVFSTLHTNDAAGAVARLTDMGVPPYVVASGLRGVLAQRLVRRRSGDGFRGRVALFELLGIDEELRGLIRAGAPASTIRQTARERRPGLLEDGLAKVTAGLTTREEVVSIVP